MKNKVKTLDKFELFFDEENHKYSLLNTETGETNDLTSVTTLLRKHNIAPSYADVDEETLKAKAQYGKVVHEELEKYVKTGEVGFTDELQAFIRACKQHNIKPHKSEFAVFNEEIAGTVDVDGVIGDNDLPFIGDYKTTATLHKEAVEWQLSLYAYLQSDVIYEKYICFHFPDKDTCKVVELMPVPEEEIIKLLEAERNCELYKKRTLELDVADTEKIIAVQKELKGLDNRKKELEKQEAELKEFLISKMEETGVKSIDNDYFKITYIAPTTKELIDSARLKKEQPDLASQYLKTSITKASVRITLKVD